MKESKSVVFKNNIIKHRRKQLEFLNDLNNRRLRLTFSVDQENILMMDTKLPFIYNGKEFNKVLKNVGYDLNDLLLSGELSEDILN